MKFLFTLVLLIIGITFGLFILSFFIPKSVRETLYGSARFARSKVLRRWNKGIKIDHRRLTFNASKRHLLISGPSGSSKTQSLLAKQLFDLARRYSIICNDPKLELHRLASGYLQEKRGFKVYVFNFLQPELSISWNPFHGITLGDLQGLITTMYDIVNPQGAQEAIWRYSSIDLLVNIAKTLHAYQKGAYLTLANLAHVLNTLQVNTMHVTRWVWQNAPDESVTLGLQRFVGQEDRLRHSILAEAVATIVPYCPDAVQRISSSHSLPSLEEFRADKTALFLALPVGQESTYAPFVTLFFSTFFSELLKSPYKPGQRAIAAVLDEFGVLLPIPSYSSVVSTARDKHLMLIHCVQNLSQLNQVYGSDGANVIADNCGTWLLMPGIKCQTTQQIVRNSLLGNMTITAHDFQSQRSTRMGRALLYADEIRRLPTSSVLYCYGNELPMLLRPRPLYKCRWLRWKYGLRNHKKQLVSKYAPVQHAVVSDQVSLVQFTPQEHGTSHDEKQRQFQQLLTEKFEGKKS